MTWTLTAVPSTEVKSIWPSVASLLSPAIGHSGGRIDMASVFDWIQDGRYVLWVAYPQSRKIGAAFVTREARYPRRSMLVVEVCGGGDMAEWLPMVSDTFRRYAKEAGLDGVEMMGRIGWMRPLKALGWSGEIVLLDINATDAGA